MVKLALLGATGSIGASTLSVVREQSAEYRVVLASAHRDHAKLGSLADEFDIPLLILTGISDPAQQSAIASRHPSRKIFFGEDSLIAALSDQDYGIALNAISGSAGLRASFAIARRGVRLALANKESLVMAGHLLMPLLTSSGCELLPVDSEHSALFQAIGGKPETQIRKVHITASGGAFRDLPLEEFDRITPAQALRHPNWDMGAKVTLDSATMFNKALEVMEAHWLFGLPYAKISAVMHPQSVIHSLVEFSDGSLLAQLSVPDMRLPILYALSHPNRLDSSLVATDLASLPALTFSPLSRERYPLFYLGLDVAAAGGILPTVLNSANEAALRLFLERKISFTDIHRLCQRTVEGFTNLAEPDLETIVETNHRVYRDLIAAYA